MNNNQTGDAHFHRRFGVTAGRPTARFSLSAMGRCLVRTASLLLVLVSLSAFAEQVETFVTLKVGEHTYQNVTVTTKGKNFIIISHTGGITSIRLTELPLEILQKLGYAPAPKPKKHVTEGPMWAGLAVVPKVNTLRVQSIKTRLAQAWEKSGVASQVRLLKTDRRVILTAAGLGLLLYLFYSYCGLLICQKTGNHPGVWVWLPIIQILPMLQAASMSPWWFLLGVIPGPNLVAYVVWCVRIVQARGKTTPLAVLLVVPLTSWLALAFLAFSGGNSPWGKERIEGLSGLQTAGA